MKKKKYINLALVTMMLFSTLVTPQAVYAVSRGLAEEQTVSIGEEGSEEVEIDVPSTEGESIEGEKKLTENEDEAVASEEPETIDNNGPPVEKDGDTSITEESTVPFETLAAVKQEQNLVTKFEFILNPLGTPIVVTDGMELNFDEINAIKLSYFITKPEELFLAGDTYTIQLPEFFESQVENQPVEVDGVNISSYSIVDGNLIITFNEGIDTFDNVTMNVELTGLINSEIFETQEEVVVEVPYADGSSYAVTIKAEQQKYTGEDKKTAGDPYVLNGENKVVTNQNPEYVDWTVRVNDSMGAFENATIIDDLGGKLEIMEGSFVVEKILRNYKNDEVGRETVTDFTVTKTENGFELNLGDIKEAYEIMYTTKLNRPDGGGPLTINNDARIILDGNSTDVKDTIDVTWSGNIPTIEKSGNISEDNADVIEWQVEYNYGKEALGTDIILTDALTHGSVNLDSVQVMGVETDIDGKVTKELGLVDVKPNLDADGNMVIPGLDANGKAYYVTFQSTVPVGLNDVAITNIMSDNYTNADDAAVTVNTIPTGEKIGEQLVDENGNPYIKWTITMNSKKVAISSIDITDVFEGKYLTFDTADTKLFEDGTEVTPDSYTVEPYTHDDGRIGFKLNVSDAGSHEYIFEYLTYYTPEGMEKPELANDAELIFDKGIGEGIGVDVGFEQIGPKAGIDKSGKYVMNDTKTNQQIEWTINFNKSGILLNVNSTIIDTFSSNNYSLIADSLSIKNMGNNQTLVTGTDYTLVNDANGFVITLTKPTNAKLQITYRTTADDAKNMAQDNLATLKWQGGSEEASYTLSKRGPGINKSGEVVINNGDGTKTVNWTVNFNTNKNIIYDFVLTDTNLPNSVTISNIKVTSEGNDVTEEFTVPEPTNGIFTLSNAKLEAKPYQLTYSTTLSAEEEKQEIKNTAVAVYRGGDQTASGTIPNPTLGVQKEAIGQVEKTNEGDFINWKITANTDTSHKLVNLVGAELADTIPADQRLIAGSIQIVRADNQQNVTNPENIQTTNNSFNIQLPNGSYQYIVTFQTEILEYPSVNTQLDRYTNATELTNPDYDAVSDDAYIDYFADGSSNNSTKTGVVNEDTENIDWDVTLNPLELIINNALITDQLDENQTYVAESIKVLDKNNNPIEATVVMGENNRSFEITFEGGVLNQSVKIAYSTRLNENKIGNFTVTNNIKILGGIDRKELHSVTTSTKTSQWTFGGGGVGRNVTFTLNKQHPSGAKIPNATFELVRIKTNNLPADNGVISVTTNDSGTFEINGARAGRYIVTEESVPGAYQILTEPIHIIIGYTTPEEQAAGAGEYVVTVTDANWNPIDSDVAKADGAELTINNEIKKGEVKATKIWGSRLVENLLFNSISLLNNGLNNQSLLSTVTNHPDAWFQLYRNVLGEDPVSIPNTIKKLTGTYAEEVTWENIELYAPDGTPYEFSVKEVNALGEDYTPAGYVKFEEGLNVYNVAVNPIIIAQKVLNGRDLRADEFTFVLSDSAGEKVTTATNDAAGNIEFSNFLTLSKDQKSALTSGESVKLTYYLSEVSSDLGGVTYDKKIYPINIILSVDAATYKLDIRYDYPEGQPKFTNNYVPGPVVEPIQLTAQKTLENKQLDANEFDFELVDLNNNVIQTVKNNGDGSVLFNSINYDTVGTYNYKIREAQGDLSGIKYDANEFDVQVIVSDNGQGNLVAEAKYLDGPARFINEYVPTPDVAVIQGEKLLSNRNLLGGQFEFELRDSKGDLVDTVYNNADGQIIFKELPFSKAGEYKYTVREVAGNQTGYTYDETEFNIVVNVTDNNAELTATVNIMDGPILFENAYQPTPDTAVITASKVLEGKSLVEGQFEFILRNEKGEEIGKQKNNADGSINFNGISYNAAGTYNYTIEEVNLGQNGITYDTTPRKVVVTVRDIQGELEANVEYVNGPVVFENTYIAQPDSVVFEASKVLEGQTLRAGQFKFELVDESTNKVIQTVPNNANGQILFNEISYETAGNFNYTIREVQGIQGGMTYDSAEFRANVVVKDNGEGQLIATETYSNGPAAFKNTYETAPDTVVIEASKTLEGQRLRNEQFIFELVDSNDKIIETVTNNANGQVIFDKITYDKVGEYTYIIREVEGSQLGVTYATNEIEVKVAVIDDGEGNLVAKATYNKPAVFINSYTPEPSNVVLEAEKVLEGQELVTGQFSYELIDESGKTVQTVINNADGQVIFDEINYEVEGKYTYIIREVQGAQGGMTYDDDTYTVVVNVVDRDGQLVATANYIGGSAVFTNTYTADPDSVVLEASKILEGQSLVKNQFTFELLNDKGELIQTKTNNANGQVIFDEMSYSEVGSYEYTIREVKGTQGGIEYDSSVFDVNVEVVDGREGQLIATESYSNGSAIFKNKYTPAPDKVVIEAEKFLEGQSLVAGQFEFDLVNESGAIVQTVGNNANGQIIFDELTYDKAGEYTYSIREIKGSQGGITYDSTELKVIVSVKDDSEGQLTATLDEGNTPLVFTNYYIPATDSIVVEAEKIIDGQSLAAGQFEFELVNETGVTVQTVENNANGQIIFDEITYDKVGKYTYTIREVKGSQGGVTYDTTEYEVVVTVTDDKEGKLDAEAVYSDETVVFNNRYSTNDGIATVEAFKKLEGQDLRAEQFKFNLLNENEEIIETITNDAEGNIIFTELIFTEPGEHVYFIEEVNNELGGVTYDDTRYSATIKVTDNGNGQLETVIEYNEEPIFTNLYTVATDSVDFNAKKILEGQKLVANQFTFELVNANGDILQTVENDAEGQVDFDEITYDKVGDYTYTIREVKGSQGGVTYDDTEYDVEVTVRDNGEGQLVATANAINGPAIFTNEYVSAPDSVVLEASKRLNGQNLTAGQFTFELVNSEEKVIQTSVNNSEGQIIFDEITYDKAGDYTYTIREVKGSQGGVTYDDTEYDVEVTVRDNGEGQLVATANAINGPAIFTNEYVSAPDSVVLEASKRLNGQNLTAGQFTFELVNSEEKVIQTSVNNSEGQIIFDEITYDKAGDYTYTIREVKGSQEGITYDDTEYNVVVDVVDNSEGNLVATATYINGSAIFTNEYVPFVPVVPIDPEEPGEPINSTEPKDSESADSLDPIESVDQEKLTKPKNPSNSAGPEDSVESTDPLETKDPREENLPKAGEAATYTELGAVLLLVGISLVYYERKLAKRKTSK